MDKRKQKCLYLISKNESTFPCLWTWTVVFDVACVESKNTWEDLRRMKQRSRYYSILTFQLPLNRNTETNSSSIHSFPIRINIDRTQILQRLTLKTKLAIHSVQARALCALPHLILLLRTLTSRFRHPALVTIHISPIIHLAAGAGPIMGVLAWKFRTTLA